MRFIDVHNGMRGIDQTQLEAQHLMDSRLEDEEGVHFLHAWADPTTGKMFCLSEGPSKEAVLRTHERAGHRPDEIYEVPIEVE
jgi:Nickel responsive protein SCO4226-like